MKCKKKKKNNNNSDKFERWIAGSKGEIHIQYTTKTDVVLH